MHLILIEGPFAEVYAGGNATSEYIPDGDDLLERANAIRDTYWAESGRDAQVIQRGMVGWSVGLADDTHHRAIQLYVTREAAETAIVRMDANRARDDASNIKWPMPDRAAVDASVNRYMNEAGDMA